MQRDAIMEVSNKSLNIKFPGYDAYLVEKKKERFHFSGENQNCRNFFRIRYPNYNTYIYILVIGEKFGRTIYRAYTFTRCVHEFIKI